MQIPEIFKDTDKEIFLVEELENRIAIEVATYQHRLSEDWQNTKLDPQYFPTFITGPLYAEYVQAIYDRIKPLNSHEINRFLTLSLNQFKTHTPEIRTKTILENFWDTYWYPNAMDFKPSEFEDKLYIHVLKHYSLNFHLFREATEKAIADFKAGLLGTPPIPVHAPALQVQNAKLKTNLSVPQLALLFKMLNELKPDLFDIQTETELHRFIAANFETKKSGEDGISPKKLKNLFNQPDGKAADFWEKHFHTLLAEVKKFK